LTASVTVRTVLRRTPCASTRFAPATHFCGSPSSKRGTPKPWQCGARAPRGGDCQETPRHLEEKASIHSEGPPAWPASIHRCVRRRDLRDLPHLEVCAALSAWRAGRCLCSRLHRPGSGRRVQSPSAPRPSRRGGQASSACSAAGALERAWRCCSRARATRWISSCASRRWRTRSTSSGGTFPLHLSEFKFHPGAARRLTRRWRSGTRPTCVTRCRCSSRARPSPM